MIPYENCKVLGPYKRKDGRMHVCIQIGVKNWITVSYPKFWMEKHLGRYLTNDEHVHHKDENSANNDPSNFELRQRSEHLSEHGTKYVNDEEVICFWCEKKFKLNPKRQSIRFRDQNRDKVGPFCSRRCSGLYGQSQWS